MFALFLFSKCQRPDLETKQKACLEILDNDKTQLQNAKIEVAKPFHKEEELKEKTTRLNELNIILNMDKKDEMILDSEPQEQEEETVREREYER